MFPCCWITALVAILAGFGISVFKPSKELIIFEVVLIVLIAGIFILRKIINKKSKCCSKENKF